MHKWLFLEIFILAIFEMTSCTNNCIEQSENNSNSVTLEIYDEKSSINNELNINTLYEAKRNDGTLILFDDYDTVISLCNDACNEFIEAIKNKNEADFTPYISNSTLIEYLNYRVNNHIYDYNKESKYRLFITEVDFKDDYALIKGNLATYDSSSVNMEGTQYFIIKCIDKRCVISEWYWDGLDSPDVNYRGAFSISNNLDYWDNYSKYNSVMDELGINY